MIAFQAGARVWIEGRATDMRCGLNSLALKVKTGLGRDPHADEILCVRGHARHLVKILWHDGVGRSLHAQRLEAGKFIRLASGSGGSCRSLRCMWGITCTDHPFQKV